MIALAQHERRVALDDLVERMLEPGFATRYRRAPSFREVGGHVSASILGQVAPRSKYVRRWRRHARTCAICRSAFLYFGLPVG